MAPRRSLTGLAAQCSIFFFSLTPLSPPFAKKKESDGLGESESEIEEDEGESFGVGRAGVLGGPTGRGCEPQAAAPPSTCPGSGPAWPRPSPNLPLSLCLCFSASLCFFYLCASPLSLSIPDPRSHTQGRHLNLKFMVPGIPGLQLILELLELSG